MTRQRTHGSGLPHTVTGGANDRLRIVVLGYVVRYPMGGMAWLPMNYALGLARLGHDVWFLEDSEDFPSCFVPQDGTMTTDPAVGLRFAAQSFGGLGLGDRWAFFDEHRDRWLGPASPRIPDVCASADVVLNVGGVNPLRPWLRDIPIRVLIDTDPAFTQVRHLNDPAARGLAAGHTHFLSYGANFGRDGCGIPDDGFPWRPARPPVALEAWPDAPGRGSGAFTTVMQWDSYEPVTYAGTRFGTKRHVFEPYAGTPERTAETFRLAVAHLPAAETARLRDRRWDIVDPRGPARTSSSYRQFLSSSKAEFTVAKEAYVLTRSGWFSERSACYLATGRPVVTQDTGFASWLDPAAGGVLAFNTPDEAVAAVREVDARYRTHCRRAREVAEAYFDSDTVLGSLLDDVSTPNSPAGGDPSQVHAGAVQP